ncbi:BTAD domain-containing putative transcriptional regulator [Nonomuraea sp. NPDC050536]|uniref:AfsR/SARP family transcriptional regulator n=1 Tax=Nonomuraea sp. NPDC050536 TaxID=3364366 RepID=UPI0037C81E98
MLITSSPPPTFRLLGPLVVRPADDDVPLRGFKQRMLLAELLINRGKTVSVDQLIDILWPASAPSSSVANVRKYVHALRTRLWAADVDGRLQTRPGGYAISLAPGELDIEVFDRLAVQARDRCARGLAAEALDLLDEAAALWRGDPLEDLQAPPTWLPELTRLRELRLAIGEQRSQLQVTLGHHAEAIAEIRGLLAEHPLREELWKQLMLALYRSGRQAEALRAYVDLRRELVEAVGAEPGREAQHLYAAMLDNDPSLEAPVRRGTLLRRAPCLLPPDTAGFVGRNEETKLLADTVAQDRPAVVTIHGLSGAGKTALAIRAAHLVRADFPDGQLFVRLRGPAGRPRDPAEVLGELLRAIGSGEPPQTLAERVNVYRSLVADRAFLLVVDDAADESQVQPLLPGTGGSTVIVTSRTLLPGLPGTRLRLDVPRMEEALELFSGLVGRTRVDKEREAAQAVVDACGGLPLAVHVAGARLAARPGLPMRTLAERLQRPESRLDELAFGPMTVRGGFAESYDALPPTARRAFRLLGAVDLGGFTCWALAALLGKPEAATDGVLETLAVAGLVTCEDVDSEGEPRYGMHELLRIFARERAESEEDRAALTAALCRFVRECLARLGRYWDAVQRIRAEHEILEAGIDLGLSQGCLPRESAYLLSSWISAVGNGEPSSIRRQDVLAAKHDHRGLARHPDPSGPPMKPERINAEIVDER